MKDNEKQIAECVARFTEAVLSHHEYSTKNSVVANENFDRYMAAMRQLTRFGDQGLSALAKLMDHKEPVVRVMAASYLIHRYTEKAKSVLTAAAKSEHPLGGLAIVTLIRWELGRYLDPASGKETQLNAQRGIARPDKAERHTRPSEGGAPKRWNTFLSLVSQPLESLDEVQRPAALAFRYDGHVRNGGHSSHFDTENSAYDDELIQALRSMGANEQARILNEARLLNREAKKAQEADQESLWELIADLDQKFYQVRPSIEEVLVQYFNSNKAHFPR